MSLSVYDIISKLKIEDLKRPSLELLDKSGIHPVSNLPQEQRSLCNYGCVYSILSAIFLKVSETNDANRSVIEVSNRRSLGRERQQEI